VSLRGETLKKIRHFLSAAAVFTALSPAKLAAGKSKNVIVLKVFYCK
jgi:hypothetical protein